MSTQGAYRIEQTLSLHWVGGKLPFENNIFQIKIFKSNLKLLEQMSG